MSRADPSPFHFPSLIKFKIDAKQEKSCPLNFTWKIYNEDGSVLTEGNSDIHLETHRAVPRSFCLYQNYPNPFNPSTIINYQLPVTSYVDLSIYNLLGQKVIELIDEKQYGGYYQVEWDASGFASGVYYYRMSTDEGFVQTKKLVLLK